MKLPITAHEYQINGGGWLACSPSNTTDNGDGTYTITDGLNVDIPINGLEVRVKAIGANPASSGLLNPVAFNGASMSKKFQIFFIGDSLTGGIGTTGTGTAASGQYNGPNSYPNQTMGFLTSLDVHSVIRSFPGRRIDEYAVDDLYTTCKIIDTENYTDICAVLFFGANDLCVVSDTAFRANVIAVTASLRAGGLDKILCLPVLSRKDSFASGVSFVNITRRNDFNTWLNANYATYFDGMVDLSGHPEIFADNAPDDTTYFVDQVHLTDAGAAILAGCVADAITTLSMSASAPHPPVDEAADFIAATGITDGTQIAAINSLVSDLKTANIWHRLSAIYPFVGGNADAHKYNLRDSRDADNAYRLTYHGTPIHSVNGVTWDSGAYADMNFHQSLNNYLLVNASLHYYSRNVPSTPGIDMGYYFSSSYWMGIKLGGNSYTAINDSDGGGVAESFTDTGLFSMARADNPTHRTFYKDGAVIRTTSSNYETGVATGNLYLGAANNIAGGGGFAAYPSNRNCAYAAIGLGLTDAEEAAHYTIIQAFQTTLGRAV